MKSMLITRMNGVHAPARESATIGWNFEQTEYTYNVIEVPDDITPEEVADLVSKTAVAGEIPVLHYHDLGANNVISYATCLRCEHTWKPRMLEQPSQCPSCHQSRWFIKSRNK